MESHGVEEMPKIPAFSEMKRIHYYDFENLGSNVVISCGEERQQIGKDTIGFHLIPALLISS
eukprot:CAMPEP_0178568990 /NCGR_PEP_ID=MMETSP0697-20121206/16238_1 /TAXON_ID=265572 /ORGANISM="Extubocellulus spinifer, Strain CCMP396" /LENGTH=61 /DNA_ID=CAMNT_0020203197 /DNA_START=119 /DNA_END=300 /DNA_ORIENTATION=+